MTQVSRVSTVKFIQKGETGKPGPLMYPAGVWSCDETYTRTADTCPFVLYDTGDPETDLYYYLGKEGTFTGDTNPNPKDDYSSNGGTWIPIEPYDAIYAKIIMADQAIIAGAVAHDDKLMSQTGEGNIQYSEFIAEGKFSEFEKKSNLLLNWKTGKLKCNDVEIKGKITATSGEFTGTLKGVSGSFSKLNCVDNNGNVMGSITLGSDGNIWFQGGLYHQGSSKPFYGSDIWVRGAFGARYSTAIVVYGNYAYIYPYGLDEKEKRVYISLTSLKTSSGNTYYQIPLYGTTGNASGCPIDLVIIHVTSSTTYRYELTSIYKGKNVTVFNANDNKNDIYIYSNGYEIQMNGGVIGDWTYLNGFLYPEPLSTKVGCGWIPHTFRDSNWA